ncbi:MAG: methyltransferase domain-containing protein [Thermodesulfobacteriota bacterium]
MVLAHKIAKQLSRPTGFLGNLIGIGMKIGNRSLNEWTIEQLNLNPSDRVLEVGFGPGLSIKLVAENVPGGWVAGIDCSQTMLDQANRRNAAAIESGRIELKHGDVSSLPYDNDAFDKVFAVQVLYFWEEPLVILSELKRVLKPGGKIALSILDKKDLERKQITQTGVFNLYSVEEIVELFSQAGFSDVHYKTGASHKHGTGICCIAHK